MGQSDWPAPAQSALSAQSETLVPSSPSAMTTRSSASPKGKAMTKRRSRGWCCGSSRAVGTDDDVEARTVLQEENALLHAEVSRLEAQVRARVSGKPLDGDPLSQELIHTRQLLEEQQKRVLNLQRQLDKVHAASSSPLSYKIRGGRSCVNVPGSLASSPLKGGDEAKSSRLAILEDQFRMSEKRRRIIHQELARTRKLMMTDKETLMRQIRELEDRVGELSGDKAVRHSVVQEAKERLRNMRVYLGVEFVDGPANGVLITQVAPQSPAFLGGILAGDIVEEVQGNDTVTRSAFKKALRGVWPGDRLMFQIDRNGEIVAAVIELGSASAGQAEIKGLHRLANGVVRQADIDEYKEREQRRSNSGRVVIRHSRRPGGSEAEE